MSAAVAPVGAFRYDAFLSYASVADYAIARRIETFLEGFHAELGGGRVRQLEICRDGSDFRLPARRPQGEPDAAIWSIIETELRRSRTLLVLCSPAAAASPWVAKEVRAFAGDPERLLIAVTHGDDPIAAPQSCFPEEIRALGLHRTRIWYDLRRLDPAFRGAAKNADDELVRLARDLLAWNDEESGPLAAIWMREQLRRRRRSARITTAVAAGVTTLALFATWQARRSFVSSRLARTNAIVATADAVPDPLAGVLLLRELAAQEPADGMRVAKRLAATPIPLALLRGHVRRVPFAAFLPRSGRVVTASEDGTARVWRADGRATPIAMNAGKVDAFAVMPGADAFAVAADKRVGIWRADGVQLAARDFPATVERIVFSPAGERVAVIGNDGNAVLWHPRQSRAEAFALPERVAEVWFGSADGGFVVTTDGAVYSFAVTPAALTLQQRLPPVDASSMRLTRFSRDGRLVAMAFDKELYLRATAGGASRLIAHPDSIRSIDFSSDGVWLASGCTDGRVRVVRTDRDDPPLVFDRGTPREIFDIAKSGRSSAIELSPVLQVLFSPVEPLLASYGDDGVIRVWPVTSTGAPLTMRSQPGVEGVSFHPDGSLLVAGSDEGTTSVWPVRPRTEPLVLLDKVRLRGAAATADGARLVTVDGDGDAMLWDGRSSRTLPAKGAKACAITPDGKLAATAHEDGVVRIWQGAKLLRATDAAGEPLRGVLLTPGGDVIAFGDHSVVRWSVDGRHDFIGPPSKVAVVAVSADGKKLLACYDDGIAYVWDGTRRTVLTGHRGAILSGALSADGTIAVTGGKDGTARVWNTSAGKQLRVEGPFGDEEWVDSCAITADGSRIAVGTAAGRCHVIDVRGDRRQVLRWTADLAHVGVIMQMVFSEDGDALLTAGGVDGVARLWDLRERRRPVGVETKGAVIAVGFVRDGQRAFTASEDGELRVWRTEWSDLVTASAARTTATLSIQQRMIALGETEADARVAFEKDERRYGRLPLPESSAFTYPSF
ncbi:MAG TPA: TIR domain-containing protein [Thermoanaerobaculia bacterium]|nr:TIR domain-containing protein [Thermoanaerobaculia bacterium]